MTNTFSQATEQRAFRASNGEYAWQRQDIAAAVHELMDSDLAVLGGEIWVIANGQIHACPPVEGVGTVIHWGCERKPGETWKDFVHRAGAYTLEAINDLGKDAEAEIDMPVDGRVFYNLAWCTESEFSDLGSGTV